VPLLASRPSAKGSPATQLARGAEICAASARYDAHVGVAQLVEHRFCKPKVRGSSPLASSNGVCRTAARSRPVGRRCSRTIRTFCASLAACRSRRPDSPISGEGVAESDLFLEGCPSGQREQAVNLPASAYVGSNPSPSTSFACTLARSGLRSVRMVARGSVCSARVVARGSVFAGVAQLVERQPSKLNVVGSSPISRSAVDGSSSISRWLRVPEWSARKFSCPHSSVGRARPW
jgi:hypothetical protein